MPKIILFACHLARSIRLSLCFAALVKAAKREIRLTLLTPFLLAGAASGQIVVLQPNIPSATINTLVPAERIGSMFALPVTAPVNSVRILQVQPLIDPTSSSCHFSYYRPGDLDFTDVGIGIVHITPILSVVDIPCYGVPYPYSGAGYSFIVTVPGKLTFVFSPPNAPVQSLTLTTTAIGTATARNDVSGMWYDTTTNGSGISIQHKRSPGDVAFGTWFMYDKAGVSRWYSLQSGNWTAPDVWEGVLIETIAQGYIGCALVAACPARFTFATPVYPFKIRFQSSSLAIAEVYDLDGSVLFGSALRRLDL